MSHIAAELFVTRFSMKLFFLPMLDFSFDWRFKLHFRNDLLRQMIVLCSNWSFITDDESLNAAQVM